MSVGDGNVVHIVTLGPHATRRAGGSTSRNGLGGRRRGLGLGVLVREAPL